VKANDFVIYVDPTGKPHNALVVEVNPIHPEYLSLIFVEPDSFPHIPAKLMIDVAPISDVHKVNGWKGVPASAADLDAVAEMTAEDAHALQVMSGQGGMVSRPNNQ